MDQVIPQDAEALAVQFEQRAAELLREVDLMSGAEAIAMIILVGRLPMQVTAGKSAAWCPLKDATRYEDAYLAQRHADNIVNGLGERGQVRMVRPAYLSEIETLRSMAAELRSL